MTEIRKLYSSGETSRAQLEIECRLKKNAADFETLQYLADIQWWEGEAEASRNSLSQLRKRPEFERDPEFLIRSLKRLSRWRVSTNYEYGFSEPRDRMRGGTELSYFYHGLNQIRASVALERRKFGSLVTLDDLQWSVGHQFHTKSFYLQTDFSQTPKADFLPRYEVFAEPHFVWGQIDFSVAGRFRKYAAVKTFALKPALRVELSDQLGFFGHAEFGIEPNFVSAGSFGFDYVWLPSFKTRAAISGGLADEGDSIFDEFISFSFGATATLFSQIDLGADFIRYAANRRDENTVALRLEVWF